MRERERVSFAMLAAAAVALALLVFSLVLFSVCSTVVVILLCSLALSYFCFQSASFLLACFFSAAPATALSLSRFSIPLEPMCH